MWVEKNGTAMALPGVQGPAVEKNREAVKEGL